MKAALIAKARALGFDQVAFTTAAAPSTGAAFQGWIEQGRQGEMGYLERGASKRLDPQLILPGAASIMALATSYHLEKEETPGSMDAAQIARYARFADYHNVLGQKLAELTTYLNELGGVMTRSLWYVDTGPILERDLAQRAGLGFVGKHTNLISRQLGNWFFISEILTTVSLEPDLPEHNRCGNCTRCLQACPTGALTGPFQMDARRCISYLTIELKGSIPVELRPLIGGRFYGCDICLEACPWNRFAREGELMKGHARTDLSEPNLLELLSLTPAGFKKQFEGTPILRTKRRGLLRNVAVALGNIGTQGALPALHRATNDAEPLVAEHATWATQEIKRRGV